MLANSHSRENGSAQTGVEANSGLANGPEGKLQAAVCNPVKPVHPEQVEGFIENLMNGSTGSP